MSGRHRKKNKAHKTKGNIPSTATGNRQPSETPAEAEPKEELHKPQQKHERALMKFKIFRKPDSSVNVWTLVVTVIIAAIYFFQLLSMQQSVELTRKAMKIDQRAWLVAAIPTNLSLTGADIPADIKLTDIGKTVAMHVVGKVVGMVMPRGAAPTLDQYTGHASMTFNSGAVYPSTQPPLFFRLKFSNMTKS